MISIFFFFLAVVCTIVTTLYHGKKSHYVIAERLLGFILLFNLGIMSLLAAYMHVFMGPETAAMIGWEGGSPFQFEMGMANLAFGVLGVTAFWVRERFWVATIIGWSILFVGCFVGHVRDYYVNHNVAPYNIGLAIWMSDLFLPLFALVLLGMIRSKKSMGQ